MSDYIRMPDRGGEIQYIAGAESIWSVKPDLRSYRNIGRNLSRIFMAIHRMNESTRYKPHDLNCLLDGHGDWILYNFARAEQNQFIGEIAAEIAGYQISPAGVRQGNL